MDRRPADRQRKHRGGIPFTTNTGNVDCTAQFLEHRSTRQFSPLLVDYVEGHRSLNPFYRHRPEMDGIREAVTERRSYPVDRKALAEAIAATHGDRPLSESQQRNLDALLRPDTFTVCSAHQPNLFTGYLYFVYKILHSVALAKACNEENPGLHFVPVFVLGSEDNDLEELNRFHLDGKTLVWNTRQTGAVGRMTVDSALLRLIDEVEQVLGREPHGRETVDMLRDAYREGATVAEAITRLIDGLFSEHGLLVLQPDKDDLKRKMVPVFREEFKNQRSYTVVQSTVRRLEQVHKVQVNPREINLFYLEGDARNRIVKRNNSFFVDGTTKDYNGPSILEEVERNPGRFSPNVVLRGLYQETLLPNVAFIGGGSEIAYWLELRDLFDHYRVPFPVLVPRNSFLLVEPAQRELLSKSGCEAADLFRPEHEVFTERVRREATHRLELTAEIEDIVRTYSGIGSLAEAVDPTLGKHVSALEKKSVDRLRELEKKMLRAEKRRREETGKRLQKARRALFPNSGLQERHDIFLPYHARYGRAFIDCILRNSRPFGKSFGILSLDV